MWSGPGDMDQLNPAVTAFDSWHASLKMALMLKEVQVTPRSLNCIMNGTSRLAAYRARELDSCIKIDMQVQLLFFNLKVDGLNIPRFFQTKGDLEEFFLGEQHKDLFNRRL